MKETKKYYPVEQLTNSDSMTISAFTALQEVRKISKESFDRLYHTLANKVRDDIGENKILGLGVGYKKGDESEMMAIILVFDIELTEENKDFVPHVLTDEKGNFYIEY